MVIYANIICIRKILIIDSFFGSYKQAKDPGGLVVPAGQGVHDPALAVAYLTRSICIFFISDHLIVYLFHYSFGYVFLGHSKQLAEPAGE